MRRIAIENPDGSLCRFDSGKVITFKTVGEASPWLTPGQRLKPIDVPNDHKDALVAGPVH